MNNLKKRAEADASMNNSDGTAAEHSVDRQLREMFGFTDEMLLAEFEAAEKDTTELPIPAPPKDEFETIWSRIQAEADRTSEKEPKIIRIRFNWKRIAAIGLIACMMAGAGCFVALGRKSYFYRERILGGGQDVLINDEYKEDVNGEDEAYEVIENKLGITPLRLGYMPPEMRFYGFELWDGYAKIKFLYKDEVVYFIQSKHEKPASLQIDTDGEYKNSVYNKWLKQNIELEKEKRTNGTIRYAASFMVKGAWYRIIGGIEEKEFSKIIERIML